MTQKSDTEYKDEQLNNPISKQQEEEDDDIQAPKRENSRAHLLENSKNIPQNSYGELYHKKTLEMMEDGANTSSVLVSRNLS